MKYKRLYAKNAEYFVLFFHLLVHTNDSVHVLIFVGLIGIVDRLIIGFNKLLIVM